MTKPAIVVTGADLAPQALDLLQKFEIVYAGKTPDEEGLVELCEQTQPVAILVRYGKVPARVMDASRNLKVIAKHGVGIDTIDSQAAAARGIAVKPAVGANADAVAEHTWALIFDCAKGISHLNARMHKGHWDKAAHKSLELKGKTLGLVGLGAIGQRVASVGTALGMRVIAYDPYAAKAPAGITMCELATVVAESDVLSLHCPLTPQNRNMIDRDVLARMRDGAVLVNTARGGLVDEARAARRDQVRQAPRGRARQLPGRADGIAAHLPRRSQHHADAAYRRRDERCLREHGDGGGAQHTRGAGRGGVRARGRGRVMLARLLVAGVAALGIAHAALAQYPEKPVRIVVGYPPGGPTDVVARLIADRLTQLNGQNFIVDNKPGASSVIATAEVIRAPADGYTLLMAASNHATNPAILPKIPYNTLRELTGVMLVAEGPHVLVANPKRRSRRSRSWSPTRRRIRTSSRTRRPGGAAPSTSRVRCSRRPPASSSRTSRTRAPRPRSRIFSAGRCRSRSRRSPRSAPTSSPGA